MSAQPFEIRCPACGAVVPPEAKGCSCATAASRKRSSVVAEAVPAEAGPTLPSTPVSTPDSPRPFEPGDVVNMRMKDYHQLVRHNYSAVEGIAVRTGGSRARAYLPFVLLVLGLLIGAGLILGKF
jgi:hypothetical protein